jgi:hypothetical protein
MANSSQEEPIWLSVDDAVAYYGNSRSSMDRWLRENPHNFVVKTEDGKRYIDIANSKAPEKARLKGLQIPEGFITLGEAEKYYNISRSAVHSWVREGHLAVELFGSKKYIDIAKSRPPNTRHEPAEMWKEIPEFSDYEASLDGRIRNKKTYNVISSTDVHGYCQVCLYKDGVQTGIYAHCAIARTWIPNPENKRTVNHKNQDKKDNRIENLEWATPSEQNKHKSYGKYMRDPHVIQASYEDEEWRGASIAGYKVSNYGRIKNRQDVILQHNPNTKLKYIEFGVYIDEKARTKGRIYVHREVAQAFLGDLTGKVVNHKDGNRHNNHLSNIEITTQSENVKHAYDIGLNKNRVGIKLIHADGTEEVFTSIKTASAATGFKSESIGYASKHGTKLGGHTWERM